eukprot:TRINITY_DN9863_c2_g1_i1.p3 TRINITY_DN9863_c2_g1~~TRINITY_DN9863_c2_g1_i1.p3  ORF type:complete len:137 (-),score=4.21 TRINITY_DN9863_c2_g1_i1:55-465(-)
MGMFPYEIDLVIWNLGYPYPTRKVGNKNRVPLQKCVVIRNMYNMCQELVRREYLGRKYVTCTTTNCYQHNIQHHIIVQQLQYIGQVLQQLYREEQLKVRSGLMLQQQLQDENKTNRITIIKKFIITNLRGEFYFLQ